MKGKVKVSKNGKWRWIDVFGVINLCVWTILVLLLLTTTITEKEKQAVIVSGGAFAALLLSTGLFVSLKVKGKLESKKYQRLAMISSAIYSIFIVSLFIPTQHEKLKDRVGTSAVAGVPDRLDPGKNPGAETIQKIGQGLQTESLTLSIYDICIGKYKHQVHRDGPVNPQKAVITNPEILTRKIKDEIKSLGADIVGVTHLKPQYVYAKDANGKQLHLDHKYAIVIGKGIDYRLANPTAPLPYQEFYSTLPESIAAELSGLKFNIEREVSEEEVREVEETLQFFSEGGSEAIEIAKYIRNTYGFEARAHFHRWGEVLSIPLAVEAGLGECAKNGMIINNEFGPRGSFSVVTTNLPLAVDKPVDLGIVEFCKICNKCAAACPVKAIPTGNPAWMNHVLKWRVDGNKCWDYIVNNPKCMSCMGSCPYNKPDFFVHRAANFMIARKSYVTNYLLTWLDDIMGYGKKAFTKTGLKNG